MNGLWLLTKRSVRETLRMPEATLPVLFIPLFFLLINRGQLGDQFEGLDFLGGQDYSAFQLPVSLMFCVTSPAAGFALVTEIENGYFDKLLVAPISRTAMLAGRLAADFVRNVVASTFVLLISLTLGTRIETGVLGAVVCVLLIGFFGVAYAGLAVVIALKSKTAQAVNLASFIFFPLLFLAPNVVPRENMEGWLEGAARYNPVTYVIEGIRALVLDGWDGERVLYAILVIVGTAVVLMTMSLRALHSFGDD